jgi:hypothetical protein
MCFHLTCLGNASLIAEALRHYQRLEHQHDDKSMMALCRKNFNNKQHRRHYQQAHRSMLIEHIVQEKFHVSFNNLGNNHIVVIVSSSH